MRLQSIIIPNEEHYTELYYRGNLSLAAGDILTFDTYFNSFSYTKYREYTTIKNACFTCKFTGKASVELCFFDGEEHTICSDVFSGKAELSVDFSNLPQNGFLYPKITAITECDFKSGEYSSDCEPRNISCCIAICTYKRENFVLKNTELLRNYKFSFINQVFVIDNGNTLDCKSMTDDFIKVLPNKNYGGSGGFTRGLIEAYDGGFSHVILMDDDVEFHPETLEQMTVFIALMKNSCLNYWISTGMLPIDNPYCQFELGAEWDGKRSIVHKHNVDITEKKNLLENLDNSNVEYGGWWTLLMPVSVTEKGLPYPFFIKFDDVEYGLRKSSDTQIITMNGIAVKHEAFDKKKSFVLDYYNLRNELVVNAVYNKYGAFGAVKRFLYEIMKNLCLYRYDNIPLVFRAINDFLSGTDFFIKCNEELLNKELIEKSPKLEPLDKIPQWNDNLRCDDHQLNKKISPLMILTLGGHIIPAFMLKKEITAVPLSRTGAVDCFGRKEVIQYQLGGNTGVIAKRNFKKFFKYFFVVIGVSFKLLFGFKTAQKSYQKRKNEITSMEFWRKHLGLK